MLGGRKTAKQDGIEAPLRDDLYSRMCSFPEGALFRQEDVVKNPSEARDFAALRDYDYVHVVDGFLTRIVETEYLRRIPSVDLLVQSYIKLRDIDIIETGDRSAYRLKLKQWAPIEGFRFYSSGDDEILSLSKIKIRFYNSPGWIRERTCAAELFRCFYDQPVKDADISLARAEHPAAIPLSSLQAAADFGLSVPLDDVPEGWQCPHQVSRKIIDHIANQEV